MNLPKPKANVKEYQRILQMGFEQFPERKINFERAGNNNRGEYVECFPIKMDYEVSNKCNFRCKMCLMSEKEQNNLSNMKFEDFEKSILEQTGLIEVKLQGMGEPLLNRDFFKMADLLVQRNIWARTTTNASLLHINDNYKRIIDCKLGEIQISIDGATKDVFERIRVGSNFEQIIENVTMMNEYARSKDENWRTSCWMLVQKDNYMQMEEVLKLADKMKFTRMTYSLAIGNWGREDWDKKNSDIEVLDILTEEKLLELVEKGKKLGIEVSFWDGSDKYIYDESKCNLCQWLFERAYISADMKIVPCCVITDTRTYNLGCALPFFEDWNGDKYKELRKLHLEGQIPAMCKKCYI